MKQKIDLILGTVLALLMAIMTLDVLWGVFTRYVLGNQASWSDELARFLLIWVGILGAAYVSGQRQHLAIDLLGPSLKPNRQQQLQLFISSLIVFFAVGVMVVGGIRLVYITQVLEQLSSAMQIPMGIVYSVVPISGLLIVYYEIEFRRGL